MDGSHCWFGQNDHNQSADKKLHHKYIPHTQKPVKSGVIYADGVITSGLNTTSRFDWWPSWIIIVWLIIYEESKYNLVLYKCSLLLKVCKNSVICASVINNSLVITTDI